MTLGDYLTTLMFVSKGVVPWDDWVEDDSGITNFVRSMASRRQMQDIG
jgi:hypothetical protein